MAVVEGEVEKNLGLKRVSGRLASLLPWAQQSLRETSVHEDEPLSQFKPTNFKSMRGWGMSVRGCELAEEG
jgi:hypothetical protein